MNRIRGQSALPPRLTIATGTALAAAGAAVFNGFSAYRAEARRPAFGRRIEIDRVALHFLERGEGEPLVLVHGAGTDARDFFECGLVDRLAERFRVIAFDRPGFGYTERPRDRLWTPHAQAELLRLACQAMGIARPHVLGHSFGTLVALEFALMRSNEVRSLVLLSGFYFPQPRFDAVLQVPSALPAIGDLLHWTVAPLLSRMALPTMRRRMFEPQPVDPRFVAALPTAFMVRPAQLRAVAEDSAMLVPGAASASRRYDQLTMPVTLLAGTQDRVVSAHRHTERLAHRIPHARLDLVEGAGHMLHWSAPDRVVDATRASGAETSRSMLAPPSQTQH